MKRQSNHKRLTDNYFDTDWIPICHIWQHWISILQIIICAKYPKAHITVRGSALLTQIVAAAVLTTNIAIYFSTLSRNLRFVLWEFAHGTTSIVLGLTLWRGVIQRHHQTLSIVTVGISPNVPARPFDIKGKTRFGGRLFQRVCVLVFHDDLTSF